MQALAKGDRDELAVQAATELGVDAIVPWAAARSVSRWEGPKAEKGRQRWATIVREAVKQSIRSWLPPVAAADDDRRPPAVASRAVGCSCSSRPPRPRSPTSSPTGATSRSSSGPEGGIAPAELERLIAAGAEPVRLGASVLRTSTAGPAAIAVLNARSGGGDASIATMVE